MGTIFHENISYSGKTGNGILSIAKTGTSGLVDTYTITFTNGSTYTYQVTNGRDEQDSWSSAQTVSNSTVTFTGIDDSAGTNGYELFVNVTASSTNKNPSAEISSISGAGTSSMSITFTTDADEGASAKLRIIK